MTFALQLAQHDPLREDAVRALIELRYHQGDRAGALQTYREFTGRLRTELDVEPMRETTAVYERVLNAVDAPAALSVSPKHNLPETMTSFVGREADVETLRSALAELRLLTLVGTGGVGKSRLAIEVGAVNRDKLRRRRLACGTCARRRSGAHRFHRRRRIGFPELDRCITPGRAAREAPPAAAR